MMDPEPLRESFNHILQRSIREGITRVVGTETARCVEFYLDSSLAMKNIVEYTKSLENFSVSSKHLEERCAEALYSNLGLRFEKNESFKLYDYVREAKKIRVL